MAEKVGQTYVSRHGTGLTFTIKEKQKDGFLVRVQRRVRTRDGEGQVEERERLVSKETWPHFVSQYEKQ